MRFAQENLGKTLFISLFFLGCGIYSQVLNASTPPVTHSHNAIQTAAKEFLINSIDTGKYSRINIQTGSMDNRLQLQQCSTPLTNKLAPGAQLRGKTTVHVQCTGDNPWTVYLSAQIQLFTQVIQTVEPLDRGHILKKSDLIATEVDISRLNNGYFTDMKNLLGKQLKRRLPQNKLIKPNYVKSPTLVKRGELVSIIAKNTGYSVKMTGTAMMSGAKGDRVRVKNTSSKRIVEGTVLQAGIIGIQ